MKELITVVNESINKLVEDGTVEKIIKTNLEKTLKEAIESVFRSYGDFGKNLESYLKNTIQIDFNKLGFEGYNDVVLKIVKKLFDEQLEIVGKQQIEKSLKNILSSAPAEIKLSELVDELKGENYGQEDGECTCTVEHKNGYVVIYLDENENVGNYRCKYRLQAGTDGRVYGYTIDGNEEGKRFFVGDAYGFEKSLFQLYACNSKLILDEDSVDTAYSEED